MPVMHWAAASCGIVFALLAGCASSVPAVGAAPKARELSAGDLERLSASIVAMRKYATGDEITCVPAAGPDPVCPVTVQLTRLPPDDKGVAHCVAKVPATITIHGATSGGREKQVRLVWSLDQASIGDATYMFQEDFGILIVWTGAGMKQQLVGGKRGAGQGNTDPDKFHVPNKRNALGAAIYYPVVLQTWTDQQGKLQESMCAAIDPRIVNTP